MEDEQEIAIAATPSPDYSVWGLVMQADPVVKGGGRLRRRGKR